MGINFKEVAILRGDDKKFEDNYNLIDWGHIIDTDDEDEDEEEDTDDVPT